MLQDCGLKNDISPLDVFVYVYLAEITQNHRNSTPKIRESGVIRGRDKALTFFVEVEFLVVARLRLLKMISHRLTYSYTSISPKSRKIIEILLLKSAGRVLYKVEIRC